MSTWGWQNKSMKVAEHLIKLNRPGHMTTNPVAGKNREENTPRLQVPRKIALTNATINMLIA